MEVQILAHLDPHVIRSMVSSFRRSRLLVNHATFSGLPTSMFFPPGEDYQGSVHFMYFPAGTVQELHRHPTPRYLLGFGEVDVLVHHTPVEGDADPHAHLQTSIAPANTACAIRFPANYWHFFEARGQEEQGAVFFSFHDRDEVGRDQARNEGLMEELTEFWQELETV